MSQAGPQIWKGEVIGTSNALAYSGTESMIAVKKSFSAGTWPSLDVVPDAFDHVLVPDLKLAALVDEAG
jgi:hypothetical protein